MARPVLIVFARAPAIGVGKTRLARDIGRVEAWRVYRGLCRTLLWRLRDPRWQVVVRLAGRGPVPPDWPRDLILEDQGRGDLGQRLQRALRAHAKGRVAVIGTDAPEMTPALIGAGLAACRTTGSAFGPASDGGFWLLALSAAKARKVRLDQGIRWSHTQTLADTEAALGGRSTHIATLSDIDDGADLKAWHQRQRR
jgi:glycosyltransferase A (GT-A) superfamily protein (DUF2064 family)